MQAQAFSILMQMQVSAKLKQVYVKKSRMLFKSDYFKNAIQDNIQSNIGGVFLRSSSLIIDNNYCENAFVFKRSDLPLIELAAIRTFETYGSKTISCSRLKEKLSFNHDFYTLHYISRPVVCNELIILLSKIGLNYLDKCSWEFLPETYISNTSIVLIEENNVFLEGLKEKEIIRYFLKQKSEIAVICSGKTNFVLAERTSKRQLFSQKAIEIMKKRSEIISMQKKKNAIPVAA